MRSCVCLVRLGIFASCLLLVSVRAKAQDRQLEFQQMVTQMEGILPQSTLPVTRDRLLAIRDVLNQLANVTGESSVPVAAAGVGFVPQTQVVADTIHVPVVGRFGRIIGSQPMVVQRQVTVLVPQEPIASAQTASPQARSTPQSTPQAPAKYAPAPQPPSPPSPEMTTIERNRTALLQAVTTLLAKSGGLPEDTTDPSKPTNPATAISFRHLAIQTYSLVISAQRLFVQNPPSLPGTSDTQPGSVINLPKP
jgi:hypothetical protein